MRIQQTSYSNSSLVDMAERYAVPRSMTSVQRHSVSMPMDDISISEEGKKALREKLREFNPESGYADGYEMIQDTNEISWEHYAAMRKIGGLSLKDGNYDVEDVMKSMMDAYESLYNKIVEEHEKGDRQVSYELTGKRSLTLEEDLAGLDKAYEMCLANLEGYITCQQTNKAFENPGDISWYFNRIGRQYSKENSSQNKLMEQDNYNYFDKDYQDAAVSMMKQARKEFLALFNNAGYKKGAAIGIISDILNKNVDFTVKTKKLFF